MRQTRSLIAGECVALAVCFALFVSGAALNLAGLNYSTDVSSGGIKIHPYTWLTIAAFAVIVAGPRSLRLVMNSARFRVAASGASVICAILIAKSLQAAGQSLGFAIDTLVAAFVLAAVLPLTSMRVAARISKMITAFILIESMLAMLEAAIRINFISIDEWYGSYFRSTALHGHPLNNSLVLVTLAVCQQTCARRVTSAVIFVFTVGALMAFGARGALMIYLLFNAFAFARYGLASAGRMAGFIAGGAVCAAGIAWLLLSGAVGTRIAHVGAYDDSAAVRLKSLELIRQLDGWQLLLGNSAIDVTQMMGRVNIGVIENFLVAYILTFGIACTMAIAWFIHATCRKLVLDAPDGMRRQSFVILLVFFAVALTNNSLITKTPALFLLVAGIWCVRCRAIRRAELVARFARAASPPGDAEYKPAPRYRPAFGAIRSYRRQA